MLLKIILALIELISLVIFEKIVQIISVVGALLTYAGAVASYAELTGRQNAEETTPANTEPSANVSAESGSSSAE